MTQSTYATAVLADSPDLYWKLGDASGNPVDSSGNGRDATSTSSITYQQTGPMTGSFAVSLASGGQVLRSSVPNSATNNVSIETWFKLTSHASDQRKIVYSGNSASNGYGLLSRNGGSKFIEYLCGGAALGGNSNGVISTSVFKHLVLVRRSGAWEYWIDGAKDSATPGSTAPVTPSGNFGIGETDLVGLWSNVAIYSTALSQARIEAHFAAASAVPSSGGSQIIMV
jgi:hypothetical protein